MSKRQKLSFFHLESLPDEIILEILSLLGIKGVLQCGQVSKRLRAISKDQKLWLKLNLFEREVPFGLIEKAIQNGCEYLNLGFSVVNGGKKSEVPWKLKYLELSQSGDIDWAVDLPAGVLENCHSLQKLAIDSLMLNSEGVESICQNGETLRILSFEGCSIDWRNKTELIQKLFTKCPKLTELNLQKSFGNSFYYDDSILEDPDICALVENLTPNILKLDLGYQKCVEDKHVNTLVRRCNNITELDLKSTSITNESVKSIIEHLNYLEKLDVSSVSNTNVDFSMLLRLKSIPTLKVLRCGQYKKEEDIVKIENLKLQLPDVSINEEYLNIASPTRSENGSFDLDMFWEIRAEQQKLFRRSHDGWLTMNGL